MALHLLFRHLFRNDIRRRDAYMFNIAADLVVNQFVKPWPLPEGAVTLDLFPDMGLLPDQTLEWYYDRLCELRHEPEKLGVDVDRQCAGQGQGQDQGQGEDESQDWGQGGGARPDYDKTFAPQSAEALDRPIGFTWHSDHSGWASSGGGEGEGALGGGISQGVRRAMETELERQLVQAKARVGPKGWGQMPGALTQQVQAIIERRKPKVDWRRALRLFSCSSRRTRIVATGQKESKRFGTFHGIKVKRYQHMAVIIDTSGSVPDSDLTCFFAEVHGMWRQGAEVDVVECDAAVQRIWEYRGRLPEGVAGRGGTAFDPAFQWMRDQRMRQFDGCIYLTSIYLTDG